MVRARALPSLVSFLAGDCDTKKPSLGCAPRRDGITPVIAGRQCRCVRPSCLVSTHLSACWLAPLPTGNPYFHLPSHTSEAGSSSTGPGCLDDLKKAWKEGKFKTYARWGGVLNVVVAIFLCFLLLAYVRRRLSATPDLFDPV
jgi:hypothetical protein